jgi:hypothetical protein
MDAAVAGFLGAIVGGAATFGGTVVSNAQQAQREHKKQHEQRKVEAYSNTLRSLLRVAHRRSSVSAEGGAFLGKDMIASWFDDIVDAEYWLTILSATCSSQHRESIQKAAHGLYEDVDRFASLGFRSGKFDKRSPNRLPLEAVFIAYQVVAEAARDDIGLKE